MESRNSLEYSDVQFRNSIESFIKVYLILESFFFSEENKPFAEWTIIYCTYYSEIVAYQFVIKLTSIER